MSIHDLIYKIKRYNTTNNFIIIYIVIIVIVGIISFLLGRLSINDQVIEMTNSNKASTENIFDTQINDEIKNEEIVKSSLEVSIGKYVASKNGKLYYSASCKSANRIKIENRVWFDSTIDAEKSGYSPSPLCK